MTKQERQYRYYQHKTAGLCITCSDPAEAPFVRCTRHLAEERQRREARLTPAERSAMRNRILLEHLPLSRGRRDATRNPRFATAPGPLVGHCDDWHALAFPLVCCWCQTILLPEEVSHATTLCE
jgi:hypothetical protein